MSDLIGSPLVSEKPKTCDNYYCQNRERGHEYLPKRSCVSSVGAAPDRRHYAGERSQFINVSGANVAYFQMLIRNCPL